MADHGVVCSMSRSGNVWDNAAMESFFSSHCSASKFSSIPVLTLFSPVYSDAAREVTSGLGKATDAAERYRDNIRSNREQYRRDDVQASSLLTKSWKVTTADYTPPAIATANGPVFSYNGNGKKVDRATLVNGKAVFTLSRKLSPGRRVMTVKYVGNENYLVDSDRAAVTVKKKR